MCTLAHVLEAAGLATVVITSLRGVAERMGVPRTLHAPFPLGLPLGKPGDKNFQSEVLRAAFALLQEPAGPIIRDFPIKISSSQSEPLVCPLPPKINSDKHPAVDEAHALKRAYDRAFQKNARTSVGMRINAEDVPSALEKFARVASGEQWDKLGFSIESIYGTAHDIRTYYEELACEIAESPIEPWATEQWFYDSTEAGQIILKARRAMRDNKVDKSVWFGLAPAGRE